MKYTAYEYIPLAISVDELSEILNIGRNTAYELIRSGQIQSVRIGHQIRVPKDALLRFLQAANN